MKLSLLVNILVQVMLLALSILLPVFVPMTSAQQSAIATFVGAVQALLTARGYFLNVDGTAANPTPKPQDSPKAT